MTEITLYSYFRSSAAFRVRIALNLKQLDYELVTVHLLRNGGEHLDARYRAINPQGLVPTLCDKGVVISQSTAIIEYLEEAYHVPPILPRAAEDRALVRSLAQIIACDIHPLNNMRVLNYLMPLFDADTGKQDWYAHWISEGFRAFEQLLQNQACCGRYCLGETPSLADIFLIPQVYNARRFDCAMDDFPLISGIYANCMQDSAFINAAPENQPDAEV